MEKKSKNLVVLVEGAVIAAVAMALSFVPIEGPNAAFDLSLGLTPLAVYAVRRGPVPAVAVGAVWGLLHLVTGRAYILTPLQFVFEYPFAFAFGGMFGVCAKRVRKAMADGGAAVVGWVALASVAATASRWFWHFLAGATVWAEYAAGMNPWLYSLIMNGLSFIGNSVMLVITMTALTKAAPRIFRVGGEL
ncbi:MAG: energy-coupled thiamine transporter ThiT [Clostridiales Family XIII bacterium]|jgi:thiamine transporter|nr:energy-coupled thiamine transporter ThiT [Clostridiales Family XIII bacterium]